MQLKNKRYYFKLKIYFAIIKQSCLMHSRVDLHTPKMLIIQFHTSSVWKNACHTIFIQFLKMVENWYKLISVAV